MKLINQYSITGLVLASMLCMGALFIQAYEDAWYQEKRLNGFMQAAAEVATLERRINLVLSSTYILASSVVHHDGAIEHFEAHAANLISSLGGITNLQLAPGGETRHIYPLTGHETALGQNILKHDKQRTKALLAVNSKQLTVTGPFESIQGETTVIARNPVFLKNEHDEDYFWGFVSALIDMDGLLGLTSLPMLSEKGYDYQLSFINPETGKEQFFAGATAKTIDNPITHEVVLPNSQWLLKLKPVRAAPPWLFAFWASVLVISALVSYVVFFLLRQPMLLHRIVQERTRELTASEVRFRNIFENAADAILIHDLEGRIYDGNQAASDSLGYSREELLKLNIADIELSSEFQHHKSRWDKMSTTPLALQGSFRRKSGESFPVEFNISRLNIGGQQLITALVRDVTERQKMEDCLRCIAQGIAGDVGEQFFLSLVKSLADLLRVDYAIVCEYKNDDKERMHTLAVYGHGELRANLECELTGVPCEELITAGHGVCRRHVDNLFSAQPTLAEMEADNYIGVPLVDGAGNRLGVLLVMDQQPIEQPQMTLSMLKIFATRAAAELERMKAEQHLRENEKQYHKLFLSNKAVMLLIDPADGSIIDGNHAASDFYGYPLATLQSLRISDINCLGKEELALEISRAKTEQRNHFFFRHRQASGDVRDVEVYSGPVEVNGRKLLYSIIHDITERKLTEAAQRLAATVFATSSEAIMVTDRHNLIEAVNPAFTLITGYAADEVIGKSPSLLKSGSHAADFYKELHQSLTDAGKWEGEIWNRRKDGQVYPQWLSIVSIKGDKGEAEQQVAVFKDITKRKRDEAIIYRQANYDALTDLPNRMLFLDRLAHHLIEARRDNQGLAIMFIDLDRFKWVNDTMGHGAGDQLLQEVARRLQICVRESDTVARLGGDEFTVILPRVGNTQNAEVVARNINQRLTEPVTLEQGEVIISGSIGIALFPQDAEDVYSLLNSADTAMYRAKEAGRSCFNFYK